jgi:hypothetical protein
VLLDGGVGWIEDQSIANYKHSTEDDLDEPTWPTSRKHIRYDRSVYLVSPTANANPSKGQLRHQHGQNDLPKYAWIGFLISRHLLHRYDDTYSFKEVNRKADSVAPRHGVDQVYWLLQLCLGALLRKVHDGQVDQHHNCYHDEDVANQMKLGENLNLSDEAKRNYNDQKKEGQYGRAHVNAEGLKQNLLCARVDVENERAAEATLRRD